MTAEEGHALAKEYFDKVLSKRFTFLPGGSLWCSYYSDLDGDDWIELRGEKLEACPELRDRHPNGWTLDDDITIEEACGRIAVADIQAGAVPQVSRDSAVMKFIGTDLDRTYFEKVLSQQFDKMPGGALWCVSYVNFQHVWMIEIRGESVVQKPHMFAPHMDGSSFCEIITVDEAARRIAAVDGCVQAELVIERRFDFG